VRQGFGQGFGQTSDHHYPPHPRFRKTGLQSTPPQNFSKKPVRYASDPTQMNKHPENEAIINDLIDEMNAINLVDVWCNGCQMYRQVNKVYAPYITTLDSCRFCRVPEIPEVTEY
jgi:hypothetical protein